MEDLNRQKIQMAKRYVKRLSKPLIIHFSLVAQLCPNPCNPMNHSMSGLPVHHQLPESTQTHGH